MKAILSLTTLATALCLSQPAFAGAAHDVCAALASSPFEQGYETIGQADWEVDLDAALIACRAALTDDTKTLEVRAWIARLQFLQGNYEVALEHAIVAADADNALGAMLAGEMIMNQIAGDYGPGRAFALLDQAHAAGFAPATSDLGNLYEQGLLVTQDYTRATELYLEAIAKGSTEAMRSYASMLASGHGAAEDDARAFALFLEAAELGDTEAQKQVAAAYQRGIGVAIDPAQAIAWYRTASNAGDIGGAISLANIYYHGAGVERDYAEAFRWALRASSADQDGMAFFMLGQMAEYGLGKLKDRTLAVTYYKRSAALHHPGAEDSLKRISLELLSASPGQFASL